MKSKILPIGLSLACAGSAFGGTFTPVPLNTNSYNADIVIEASATPKLYVTSTATLDNGTNNNANTWNEIGWDPNNPLNGLPHPGTVVTAQFNANYSFVMPPDYTQPNGILIDSVVTKGTFVVQTPIPYYRLSFLGSGGNGGDVIGVTVHYVDGTTEGINAGGSAANYTFQCPDWFNGQVNVVYIANERCGSPENYNTANIGSNNPRVYARDVVLTNNTTAVASVDLTYYSGPTGSHNDVLAMSGDPNGSGTVVPVTVTGYTYDFIVEQGAPFQGQTFGTNGQTATTSSMDSDSNTGNSWYEIGYNINNIGTYSPNAAIAGASGIPHPGSTISNAAGDHVFVFPPTYIGPDSVYLSPVIPSATITFASPTLASGLSFLTSAGNGPVQATGVVNYQDGTSDNITLNVLDWFTTGVPYVLASNGRAAVDTAVINDVDDNPHQPHLFGIDIAGLKGTVPITSIDLTYVSAGGRMGIFAVSSTLAPVAPSFVVEPNAAGGYPGGTVVFNALATGTAPISYSWEKGTNGVYVNLTDGGTISGSQTTNLTIANFGLNDAADYICIAVNGGGSATSALATLTVLSPLTDVFTPGDPITAYNPQGGSTPGNEGVEHAIDQLVGNDPAKYLNFGGAGGHPTGFITTPSIGRTVVTGIRFYTANDTVGRDPADYILEGSNDGGSSYATIASGNLNLPAGRNNQPSAGMDPTVQFVQQVLFANAKGYTTYRVTFPTIKDPTQNSMQIGEVEGLGVIDTSPVPSVSVPVSVNAVDGTTAAFSVTTTPASPQPAVQWQFLANNSSSWVNLSDNSKVVGSATTTLTLNPIGFTNGGGYRVIASNNSGAATSGVATLSVLSALPSITQPGDPVIDFTVNPPGVAAADPTALFSGVLDDYADLGLSQNAAAGFPPFQGPVGVIVTPAAGPSIAGAIIFYTSSGSVANDPVNYELDGSNDGGNTVTKISAGPLSLPAGRNNGGIPVDPTQAFAQEIIFTGNHDAFTSYKISFFDVAADSSTTGGVQLGQVQILGTLVSGVSPSVSIAPAVGGGLNITSSSPGHLQSATVLGNPTVWTTVGSITGTLHVTPTPGQPALFYRVIVP